MVESYPLPVVMSELCKTARATLHLLERNGLFEDSCTLAAFQANGLRG